MKNILISNTKGGVGKSLIADELAFSFERTDIPYNFYDLDSQGGTLHRTSKKENATVSVIDTPATLNDQLGQWISSADLIIIEIVNRNNNKCNVIYVLNAFNRWRASNDFYEWLSRYVNSTILFLPQSELFVQASAYRKSVVDYAPKSKAAIAILELCNKVREFLNITLE